MMDWLDRAIDDAINKVVLKKYAFCPTGEGGGVDNSCGPGGDQGNNTIASSRSAAKVGQIFTEGNKFIIKGDRKTTGYDQTTIDNGMILSDPGRRLRRGVLQRVNVADKTVLIEWDNKWQEQLPISKLTSLRRIGYEDPVDLGLPSTSYKK